MRKVTLNLTDGVHSFLSLRAAIDNLTIEQGLELLLTEMAERLSAQVEKRKAAENAELFAKGIIKKPRTQENYLLSQEEA
jgi:hypothetical protein